MARSALDRARDTDGVSSTVAPAASAVSQVPVLAAVLLAGLALIVTMALIVINRSSSVAAQRPQPAAVAGAPAAEPVKAPPAAVAQPPAAEPVKAPPAVVAQPPAIAPERLAAARQLLTAKGCIGCHTIESFPEAVGVIGPNLTHVNTEAAQVMTTQLFKDSKSEATTTREFLRESILKPSAYICQECATGPCPDFVMPRDFKARLTSDELETILDLLVTFN